MPGRNFAINLEGAGYGVIARLTRGHRECAAECLQACRFIDADPVKNLALAIDADAWLEFGWQGQLCLSDDEVAFFGRRQKTRNWQAVEFAPCADASLGFFVPRAVDGAGR